MDGQNLGFPDYDSGWLLMKSQDNELSTLDVHHGLGQLPALVDVRVKSVSEPNKDFIFKGVGTYVRKGLMGDGSCCVSSRRLRTDYLNRSICHKVRFLVR